MFAFQKTETTEKEKCFKRKGFYITKSC